MKDAEEYQEEIEALSGECLDKDAEIARLRAVAGEMAEALEWAKSTGRLSYHKRIPGQNDHWCDRVDAMNAALAKWKEQG